MIASCGIHDTFLCATTSCCKSKLLIQCVQCPRIKRAWELRHTERNGSYWPQHGYMVIMPQTQTTQPTQPGENKQNYPHYHEVSHVDSASHDDRKLNRNLTLAWQEFRGCNGLEKCTWSLKCSLADPQRLPKDASHKLIFSTWKNINEIKALSSCGFRFQYWNQ